jgi:hypothetical protein
MLYREIIAVCSQIYTKHKYTVRAERRIVCHKWRYMQHLLGAQVLIKASERVAILCTYSHV